MVLRLLIDAVHPDETRVVIADNSRIHDFDFVTASKKQVKGNIYLAKITRVEPSLQAAFVEYGGGKQGFLPFAEIHPDYYQIPTADRKRLMEEAEREEEGDLENEIEGQSHLTADATPVSITESNINNDQLASEYKDITTENDNHDPVPLPASLMEEKLPVVAEHILPELQSDIIETAPSDALAGASEIPATDGTLAAEPAAETAPTESTPIESTSGSNADADSVQEIETLASDEDTVRQARPTSYARRYKIQEVIKRNQIVLVQVIKEERGNKGVSLTTFISLAGRYCVLMPNSPKGGGISRKIMSGEDRKRLKEISSELKTARGMSAIIRTAGIDRSRAEIKRDYEYLVQLWDSIRQQTLSSTAPALIYEEGDLIKRTLRDLYTSDIEEVLVEGEAGYTRAKDFLKMILASHAPRVKLYQENVPLFYAYNIEDQLASMYDPVVKLRSGGYIVLSPTEALISIDVNSGRSTGERNIEETAAKTNLEAAAEIARQLRLRDLAGLIVIDFIDMMDSRNRRAVERALKDALKLDRAKIQLGRITPFGLLEMSRQRLRPSLSEASTMPCAHCLGKGIVRSDASVAIQLIRAIEKESASGQFAELKVTVSPSVALHLLNARRDSLTQVEQKSGLRVTVLADVTLPQGVFRVEKVKGTQPKREQSPNHDHTPVSIDTQLMDELPAVEEIGTAEVVEGSPAQETAHPREDRPRRRRGGRGRRSGPGNGNGHNFHERGEQAAEGSTPMSESEGNVQTVSETGGPQENRNNQPREPRGDRPDRGPRRERGGRNRRPRQWRDRPVDGAVAANGEQSAQPVNGNGGGYPNRPSSGQDNRENFGQRPRDPNRDHSRSQNRDSSRDQARPASFAPPLPPLGEQAASEGKAKKGWWRRIVES